MLVYRRIRKYEKNSILIQFQNCTRNRHHIALCRQSDSEQRDTGRRRRKRTRKHSNGRNQMFTEQFKQSVFDTAFNHRRLRCFICYTCLNNCFRTMPSAVFPLTISSLARLVCHNHLSVDVLTSSSSFLAFQNIFDFLFEKSETNLKRLPLFLLLRCGKARGEK